MSNKISILIIGPSAGYITGSLLRPLNIWYALEGVNIDINYLPVRSVVDVILSFRRVAKPSIVILSGVNPWISALTVLFRRLLRKTTIVDLHGFAWFESTILGESAIKRILLLVSEGLAYKLADCLITASKWLSKVVLRYFGRAKCVYIVENSTTYIFERIAKRLRHINTDRLRALIGKLFGMPFNKPIFVAPLPGVFKSNYYAFIELLRLVESGAIDGYVVVTGFKCKPGEKIACLGHIPYVYYVALLMIADVIILPYPKNAICGGARNKVLEALYLGKPIISTPTGMMYVDAKPGIHYIPIEGVEGARVRNILNEKNYKELESLRSKYIFRKFKRELLRVLINCISCVSKRLC